MTENPSIIEEYSRQVDEYISLLEACPLDAVARRGTASQRSFTEITCQLADAELMTAVRLRRIITQDHPRLYDYDEEAWEWHLGYQDQKIQDAGPLFTTLRDTNIVLLRQLDYEDWNRSGQFEADADKISLFQLIEGRIKQTAESLAQLHDLVTEFTAEKNGHAERFIPPGAETAEETASEPGASGVKFYALALMAGLTILTVGFFTQSRPIYTLGGIFSAIGVVLVLLSSLKKK